MISIIPVTGIGEVRAGDVIAELIVGTDVGARLQEGDVVVVARKIVSKAEGRLEAIDGDDPRTRRAVVDHEAVRVLRRRGELVIAETAGGFVCANAGVDVSNVELGYAALLPLDSDRSARRIRDAIRGRTGTAVAVVVSDTFGRPWRRGATGVALGVAGLTPIVATQVAVADEIAAAAALVMGKGRRVPAAIVRGVDGTWLREGSIRNELVRPPAEDLFR